MTVCVTKDDISHAGRSGGDNPVSRALFRATGQAWVVFGGNMAYSRTSPHHSLMLPFEVSQKWRLWAWEPFEFEVQWHLLGVQRRTDKRQRQRRAHPRFGHDRRARDRRGRNRRRGERRSLLALAERSVGRRDTDASAGETVNDTVETNGAG